MLGIVCECWLCRRQFMYPRKMNICGFCMQGRYVVCYYDGKPGLRLRHPL